MAMQDGVHRPSAIAFAIAIVKVHPRVPSDVHGPQRAIRFIARQPPRTTPSRAITISA